MRHDNVVGRSPARQPTSERYSQPAAEWESGGRIKRGEYEFVLVRIARNTAIHYWVITGQYSATFFFGTNIIRLLFRKQNRDLVKKVAQFSTSKYSRHARRQFPFVVRCDDILHVDLFGFSTFVSISVAGWLVL